ncbi:g4616 [Coccomyxa elongata]
MVPTSGSRYFSLALLAGFIASIRGLEGQTIDLPVATHGFEEWAGVVGKAMSFGGRTQEQSLQALKTFQSKVAHKMQEQASAVKKLQSGDFTDILTKILNPNIQITAPIFFSNQGGPDTAITDTIAAISFGFQGIGYAPCAIPITPYGVGITPQGINIQPAGIYMQPTGAQVSPQGLQIAPNLIVIGPYDTQVAPQGLNIAPVLINIAPVKTVVNLVGPLSISDSLVSVEVPTPGP